MKSRGFFLLAISAIGYGMTPILLKIAYAENAGMYQVLFYRFAIAILLLGFYLFLSKRLRSIPVSDVGLLVQAGTIGGALFALIIIALFSSMKYLSASISEVLYFTYPVWVAILSVFLYNQRIFFYQVLCIVVLLLGIFLTLDFTQVKLQPTGLLLAFLSSICSAIYIVFAKQKKFKRLDGVMFTFVIMIGAFFVFVFCYFLLETNHKFFTTKAFIAVFSMSLVSTLLSMCSYFIGIKYLSAVEVAAIATLEPIVTILCETLFLHHFMRFQTYLGVFLVIISIACFTIDWKKSYVITKSSNCKYINKEHNYDIQKNCRKNH
ncbi:MAG: DMT family transporter [Hydrogenoanaerobacterium sp.]